MVKLIGRKGSLEQMRSTLERNHHRDGYIGDPVVSIARHDVAELLRRTVGETRVRGSTVTRVS